MIDLLALKHESVCDISPHYSELLEHVKMICFEVFVLDTSCIRWSWEGFWIIFGWSWSAMMLPSLFTHETKLFEHDYYVERMIWALLTDVETLGWLFWELLLDFGWTKSGLGSLITADTLKQQEEDRLYFKAQYDSSRSTYRNAHIDQTGQTRDVNCTGELDGKCAGEILLGSEVKMLLFLHSLIWCKTIEILNENISERLRK